MSGPSVEEKLQQPVTTQGTAPRATLEQLRQRWGFQMTPGEEERVHVVSMSKREAWIRVSGRGLKALYELVGG